MNWNDILNQAKQPIAPPHRVDKTEAQWKEALTPEAYRVTRMKGTERPFSGEHCSAFGPGRYGCVCCGTPLFDGGTKFESRTGWPSFTAPLTPEAVRYEVDNSYGMQRVEVLCNVCDAHLGHVFPDGPGPGGLRFCMNSVSLQKEAAV